MSNKKIIQEMVSDFIDKQMDDLENGFQNRFWLRLHKDVQAILDSFRIFAEERYDRKVADIKRSVLAGIGELPKSDTILEWSFEEVAPSLIAAIYSSKLSMLEAHAKMMIEANEEVIKKSREGTDQ